MSGTLQRMPLFRVSLVIGGTGMLADATRWLVDHSERTILVARRANSFQGPPSVAAVNADWHSPTFAQIIGTALERSEPPDAALLWLHDPATILGWLLPTLRGARTVLVLGSMDGGPAIPLGAGEITTVRLGSVRTEHGRRWLTDDEISAAAIAALQDGESRTVGELTSAE